MFYNVDSGFGKGGYAGLYLGPGAGGGFYGGGVSEVISCGGSSYLSSSLDNKSMYCYNCTESSDTATKTVSTTNVSATPTSNYAKIGNGYARITLIN